MKSFLPDSSSCVQCRNNSCCSSCTQFWFHEKKRNYCPSCYQLKWLKALFDFSYVQIYEGIVENNNLFKEALNWPVFQKLVYNPSALTVGEFEGLYFGANLSRFAGGASAWVVNAHIRPLPTCGCVTIIRDFSPFVASAENIPVSEVLRSLKV
jgi:hypothetical protein